MRHRRSRRRVVSERLAHLEPQPLGHRFHVVRSDADQLPCPACAGPLEDASPEGVRAGLVPVHDADELEVLIAERHDAVRGAPSLVSSTDRRVEPELLPEAHRGRVEIADRVDDVIEAEHAPNPTQGAP